MSAPTYPLTMPTSPAFTDTKFSLQRQVGINSSPFTGNQQVYEHSMALWKAVVTLPPMKRDQAGQWHSFFMKLHGIRGTFLLGDQDGKNPLGAISTSATVTINTGQSIGDYQVALTGVGASVSNVFKEGDYIQIGTGANAKLHMIVANANSDGSGNVTVNVEPSLKVAHTQGTSVVITNTKGLFRMDNNELGWSANRVSVYGLSFSCTEVF